MDLSSFLSPFINPYIFSRIWEPLSGLSGSKYYKQGNSAKLMAPFFPTQRLPKWVLGCTVNVQPSTRSQSTTLALFKNVSIVKICNTATWASFHPLQTQCLSACLKGRSCLWYCSTFIREYCLEVTWSGTALDITWRRKGGYLPCTVTGVLWDVCAFRCFTTCSPSLLLWTLVFWGFVVKEERTVVHLHCHRYPWYEAQG